MGLRTMPVQARCKQTHSMHSSENSWQFQESSPEHHPLTHCEIANTELPEVGGLEAVRLRLAQGPLRFCLHTSRALLQDQPSPSAAMVLTSKFGQGDRGRSAGARSWRRSWRDPQGTALDREDTKATRERALSKVTRLAERTSHF
ncbi:hypothetical protein CapIbe_023284 [Capra ibex]